jgi:hypothetical protein
LDLDKAAQEVSSTYEVFDEGSQAYDATLTDELIDLRDFYISKGHYAADALSKASKTIAAREGLVAAGQAPVVEENPNAAPPRTVAPNVEKKLKTAEQQPARVGGESNASNSEQNFDVFSMSDDDLDSLSETQLAQLRGDVL